LPTIPYFEICFTEIMKSLVVFCSLLLEIAIALQPELVTIRPPIPIPSLRLPTPTTFITKPFSLVSLPIFTVIPGPNEIARWKYYSDTKCTPSAYLGEYSAVQSEYDLCKPLLGGSIYIEYILYHQATPYSSGAQSRFISFSLDALLEFCSFPFFLQVNFEFHLTMLSRFLFTVVGFHDINCKTAATERIPQSMPGTGECVDVQDVMSYEMGFFP
jgi:hypothetical protein